MTINIQYVDMDSSESLSAYTRGKLEKLIKKYEWLIACDVAFKLESKDNLLGHICNMELSLPGPKIFATSNEKNYEMAVKQTINDLDKQLQKRKQQFAHH